MENHGELTHAGTANGTDQKETQDDPSDDCHEQETTERGTTGDRSYDLSHEGQPIYWNRNCQAWVLNGVNHPPSR